MSIDSGAADATPFFRHLILKKMRTPDKQHIVNRPRLASINMICIQSDWYYAWKPGIGTDSSTTVTKLVASFS